jgi:NitT/TauT family transport system ATP-binding protein
MSVVTGRGAAIEIVDLCKAFDSGKNSVVAIDHISVSIPSGEFVCFVGPSGCGKSTLLRILAGLERPDSGRVTIDGAGQGARNAMVFQETSIFPWKTVGENIAFGLRARGMTRADYVPRVENVLRLVGLTKFRDHYPSQISGGMKQRAAIARAIVTDPAVLLMDEPFAALDAQNRAILQNELAKICEQTGTTVVYITHSLDEALMLGDRAIVLTAQPARIKDVVTVPFQRPRNTIEVSATAEFGALKLRMWNVLEAEVQRARREQEGA